MTQVPRHVLRSCGEVLERTRSFAEMGKHFDRLMAAERARLGTRCPDCGRPICECHEREEGLRP